MIDMRRCEKPKFPFISIIFSRSLDLEAGNSWLEVVEIFQQRLHSSVRLCTGCTSSEGMRGHICGISVKHCEALTLSKYNKYKTNRPNTAACWSLRFLASCITKMVWAAGYQQSPAVAVQRERHNVSDRVIGRDLGCFFENFWNATSDLTVKIYH